MATHETQRSDLRPGAGVTAGTHADRHRERWLPARGRVSDVQRLAGGLGWFSLGLGVASLAAPRLLARAIGAPDRGATPTVLRAVGVREIACGIGLLSRPRPAGWTWARVAGDVMDLALLTSALGARRSRPGRIMTAAAAVAGVTALDAVTARQLSRQDGATAMPAPGHAVVVRKVVTINAPREALYRFWRDFTNLPRVMHRLESVETIGEKRSRWRARGPGGTVVEWEAEVTDDRANELIAWRSLPGSRLSHTGVVRFTPAPTGRGTELAVEMAYTPPGGAFAARMARLVGQAPEQELQEDLRRLKQLMEAGDIVMSEGVLYGAARPAR
jgi:uncharacterized membrane protein